MSNSYQQMLESQYAFNEFALPQEAVTSVDSYAAVGVPTLDNTPGISTASTIVLGNQAFDQTLTELNGS